MFTYIYVYIYIYVWYMFIFCNNNNKERLGSNIIIYKTFEARLRRFPDKFLFGRDDAKEKVSESLVFKSLEVLRNVMQLLFLMGATIQLLMLPLCDGALASKQLQAVRWTVP